jgi:hypothetical protein
LTARPALRDTCAAVRRASCKALADKEGAAMIPRGERAVLALVLANVALQVIDGVATFAGLRAGFAEGNPLLGWAFAQFGAGPALCVFKLEAIAALAVVWRLRTSPLAIPALAFSAALYTAFSILPWATALAGLQYM